MPWVMLTVKPPVHPSPPKLSIFFATPWPMEEYEEVQKIQSYDYDPEQDTQEDTFGMAPTWARAMKISYKGSDIRVFPHEYSVVRPEVMREYVFGVEGEGIPSHTLVENNEASKMMLKIAKDTDLRTIYEAALVDGCNHAMAEMVTLGVPIDDVSYEFPPIGWYRPLQFVLDMYCYEDEQSED